MKLIYLNDEKTSALCLGSGAYRYATEQLHSLARGKCVVAVTDKNLHSLWCGRLFDAWSTEDIFIQEVITDGRDAESAELFCKHTAQGREILLLAVGGGTVQNTADRVARGLTRGCTTVRVPTTPMAALHSATVPGAAFVICDTDFFATLTEPVAEASAAEIVRLSVCLDDRVFSRLYETFDYTSILPPLICSLRDMKKQGMQDLTEFALKEARALMTVEPGALTMPQATAVACVMLAHASGVMGICKPFFERHLRDLLTYLGFPCDFLCTAGEFRTAMAPYTRDGKLTLILCRRPGQCEKHTVSPCQTGKLFGMAEAF